MVRELKKCISSTPAKDPDALRARVLTKRNSRKCLYHPGTRATRGQANPEDVMLFEIMKVRRAAVFAHRVRMLHVRRIRQLARHERNGHRAPR